jgi:23S rRNA pseudouridine2604 synthase
MNIHLDLPNGKFREMTKEEFRELNNLLADSSKTIDD